jgi:hypothetical protein
MSRVAASILAVILLVLPQPTTAQRNEREVVEMLTKASTSIFDRAKAKPSTEAATLVREFIEQGANLLVSDKRTSDRDLSAAVDLVRRFSSEMVKQGVRQGDGTVQLGEKSFAAAQRSLCPLYPFC